MLSKALHHIFLNLIDPLYLLLGRELRILFVILLTDVENLLAHLETTLYILFALGLRTFLIAANTRTQRPDFLLTRSIGFNKTSCGLLIESQVVRYMLRLLFSQLFARNALFLIRSLCKSIAVIVIIATIIIKILTILFILNLFKLY